MAEPDDRLRGRTDKGRPRDAVAETGASDQAVIAGAIRIDHAGDLTVRPGDRIVPRPLRSETRLRVTRTA